MFRSLFLSLILLLPAVAFAENPPAKPASKLPSVLDRLHPQSGTIVIGKDLATVKLPEGYGYLPPDETDIMLRDIIHYLARVPNLGALVSNPIDPKSSANWNAVIVYIHDGHVSEDDAKALDKDKLLEAIRKDNDARNVVLEQAGLGPIAYTSMNWEEPPHYDAKRHVLLWGMEMKQKNHHSSTIAFHIRFLGREGVLKLTISGPLGQLPMLQAVAKEITDIVTFNAQSRYEDFKAGSDKTAAYGINELVIGNYTATEK